MLKTSCTPLINIAGVLLRRRQNSSFAGSLSESGQAAQANARAPPERAAAG